MDRTKPNSNVKHPKSLLKKDLNKVSRANRKIAVAITNRVGSMWSAYLFALLSLTSLPAIIVTLSPSTKSFFPQWIIDTSMITLVAWISQNFLQLVLLPIIMVGQNVIQGQQDAKVESDHLTLTYLANTQEEQLEKLDKIIKDVEELKNKVN